MYLLFGIILLILLFFFCISCQRRKKNIKKVCSMCMAEKCSVLNRLIEPFGYSYIPSQDLFTSRIDAWQRDFGYCDLYDKAASHFNMIFDCLPVYFDYQDRTWLIEFWKGQYGINTGCEIGVYYADRVLTEDELKSTLFQCVDDKDMLKLSFDLFRNHSSIARLCAKHWWLTAFSMGRFSYPSDLSMGISVNLQSAEMAEAFTKGLIRTGYCPDDIYTCCNTVTFTFAKGTPAKGSFQRLRIKAAQWVNHFWCKVYLFVTRPFCLSIDRILYLYYYLPFAFRRMLHIRGYKGKGHAKRRSQ